MLLLQGAICRFAGRAGLFSQALTIFIEPVGRFFFEALPERQALFDCAALDVIEPAEFGFQEFPVLPDKFPLSFEGRARLFGCLLASLLQDGGPLGLQLFFELSAHFIRGPEVFRGQA